MMELQNLSILVIDDEMQMCRLLESIFKAEGARVETARSGSLGLVKLPLCQPDLILLDILMPGEDGIEICRQIRDASTVPVILLTALSGGNHIVRGLDAGADDYIVKPFERAVLLARCRAVLRRGSSLIEEDAKLAYNDGYLLIEISARKVMVANQAVNLSATEFKLLAYLLRHAGKTCTFEDILEIVWGEPYRFSAQYVHVYIWHLRRKLEPDPKQPRYLISEHGVGYRFELLNSER
ncbi:MAG TPA: response regulator transcription factor [Patescibacteria group bacterium]|nr:response regulator transcription factor [Patescibacteria group bacterium]